MIRTMLIDDEQAARERLRQMLGRDLAQDASRDFIYVQPKAVPTTTAIQLGCAVIANVVESQPYVTADHRLLAEHGADVVRGLAILARAAGARKATLAVDRRRAGDYHALEEAARACGVATVALEPIYPIGNDTILVKVLTGREVPVGGEALDVRAAVADAGTCLAACRWVACDAPPLGRVVTVAGESAVRGGNFYAPFGMECAALAGLPPGTRNRIPTPSPRGACSYTAGRCRDGAARRTPSCRLPRTRSSSCRPPCPR